jgi:hypothetical protein
MILWILLDVPGVQEEISPFYWAPFCCFSLDFAHFFKLWSTQIIPHSIPGIVSEKLGFFIFDIQENGRIFEEW